MIIDTSMVRDDMDMLQLRLEELSPLVDVHIIAEANYDFLGRRKPLHFLDNRSRFEGWRDKIIHVVVTDMPHAADPWVDEHHQRDSMRPVLQKFANPDDVVLICDGDEIPSENVIVDYPFVTPFGLWMRTCHSAVDWLYPNPMAGSVICRARHLNGHSMGEVRDGRPGYLMAQDGGWHLSWLGGPEKQREKLSVSCHLELPEREKQVLSDGSGWRTGVHDGISMVPADVDDSWPKMIYERRCPDNWFRPR